MPNIWRNGQSVPRELEEEYGEGALDSAAKQQKVAEDEAYFETDAAERYETEKERRRACKTPEELLDKDRDFRVLFESTYGRSDDILEYMLEGMPFDLADCVAYRVGRELPAESETDGRKPAPDYDLKRALIPVSRHDHLLYCRVPQEVITTKSLGSLSHLNGHRWHMSLFGHDGAYLSEVEIKKLHGQMEVLIQRYEESLRAKSGLRGGSIKKLSDDIICVELGIRRLSNLTDEDIARGIYYNGFPHDDAGWTARYMTTGFYRDLVHPYVKDNKESDPFEWALNRTEVAVGFVQAIGLGHDCPPRFAEHTYKTMAGKVCNQSPQCLAESHGYHLDEKKKPLFETAENVWGKSFCPELACFILDNADCLSPELISAPEIIDLAKKIPRCLRNGLNIYRLSEFFKFNIEKGLGVKEALEFTLEVITDIYSGDDEPWWFKEDADFRQLFKNPEERPGLPEDLVTIRKIAKAAGFSFFYTLEVYRKTGLKLANMGGIDEDEAIAFCTRITNGYGIGNVERACNVVSFAIELVSSVSDSGKKAALVMFEEHVKRHEPETELIGRMEGAETGVNFPGLISIVKAGLGVKRLKADKVDGLTIKPDHVRELAEPLSRPLIERARTKPMLKVEVGRHRLLAANLEDRLALPVAEERHGDGEVNNTLLATFEFYQQLRDECGEDTEELPEIYFSFFATKMPNPFKPPKGFLAFLKKYKTIPIPDYKPEFFIRPEDHAQRAETRERNINNTVSKYLIIGNLLDAWIIGILSDKELFEIFDWMTQEAPQSLKDGVERDVRAKYADRAEQRKGEDYFIASDIKCRIGEREVYVWKRRLKAVAESIDDLIAINIFVSLGLLTRADVDEIFADKAAFFKTTNAGYDDAFVTDGRLSDSVYDDEKINFARAIFLEKEGFTRCFKGIKAMEKLGLIDMARFREILKNGTVEERRACLRALIASTQNFQESVKKIIEVDKAIKKAASGSGPATIGEEINNLTQWLGDLWKDMAGFIKPEVSYILIASYLRAHKFVYFTAALAGFRDSVRTAIGATDPGYWRSDSMEDNVKRATASSVTLVSTVMALGEMDVRRFAGISKKALPKDKRKRDEKPVASDLAAMSPLAIVQDVSASLQAALERAKKFVIEVRKDTIGLVPVGGKIHVIHPIDEARFRSFVNLLGFSSSQFALIHAGTSVNLPAVPSGSELRAIVRALEGFGIIDDEHPELQIGGPGRLSLLNSAILGSAILLATEDGVEFGEDAFITNQNTSTGSRIMLYDAGGPRITLPFMLPIDGRTDMLARHPSGKDIDPFQKLFSALLQGQLKVGPFEKLAKGFLDRYSRLLEKYKLDGVLNQTWVMDPHDPKLQSDEAAREHFKAVEACTSAYFKCADQASRTGRNEGIIFEARALFEWLKTEIAHIQETLYGDKNACREMQILLEF